MHEFKIGFTKVEENIYFLLSCRIIKNSDFTGCPTLFQKNNKTSKVTNETKNFRSAIFKLWIRVFNGSKNSSSIE